LHHTALKYKLYFPVLLLKPIRVENMLMPARIMTNVSKILNWVRSFCVGTFKTVGSAYQGKEGKEDLGPTFKQEQAFALWLSEA
jgi:hypothetical protein